MSQKIQETALVFRSQPQGFSPMVEISACHIEFEGRILFLKRANGKSEGGKWGIPAGKIENNESALEAVVRETLEETQIKTYCHQLKFVGKLFIKKSGIDYVYHMYHLKLSKLPIVKLNNEHQEYRWISLEDVITYPVISGGLETLHHFKALANKPKLPRKSFYFIRHGETDVNADPKIKRVDYDLPLNNRGRNQAKMARKAIASMSFKSVCFSPIQRAVETKNILVSTLELNHSALEDLSECKARIWTKMVQLEKGLGYHVCNEVENFLRKALCGLEAALQKNAPMLIVAHGGIHWALCYHMSIINHPWKIGNCELVQFRPIGDTDWEARAVNPTNSSSLV